MAEAWGVWGEKSKEGRTYEGIIRSSFLVAADGRIREAWYQVAPERTVPLAWRRSRRRDGRRHPPPLQPVGGVILIVDGDIKKVGGALAEVGRRRDKPCAEAVGVDGHVERRPLPRVSRIDKAG